MSIDVSGVSFHYPDGTMAVDELSFQARAGQVTAIVGPNGVGKTTLLELIAGDLEKSDGQIHIEGATGYMRQNPGFDTTAEPTVADALSLGLPPQLRDQFGVLADLESRVATDPEAGVALGDALGTWQAIGGYEAEATWDQITRSALHQGYREASGRPLTQLSGGERKRIILASFLASDVPVLVLDEPDNFLDLNGKDWLDAALKATKKTVLMVSHDRQLLASAVDRILVLEHNSAWMHGGTYTTLPAARHDRAVRLARDLDRWHEEERRLFRHYKIMKQRASVSPDNAKRADAAESRWERFRDVGPPLAPPPMREISTRFVGSRSGKVAMNVKELEVEDLFLPFDLSVWNEDRVLLLGENGVGKSTLLRQLHAASVATGEELDGSPIRFGPTARVGYFSQDNRVSLGSSLPPDAPLLDIVADHFGNEFDARKALGRYGLGDHVRHQLRELSGGQQARVQLVLLETERPNVLLLDEPTDNLDLESILAIESALDELEATLVTISHDREFAKLFDRFVLFDHDGLVAETEDRDLALQVAGTSGFSVTDYSNLALLTCV